MSSAPSARPTTTSEFGAGSAFSVVICVYTEKRWDALLAAAASVTRQLLPDDELIIVVDHNPALLVRLTAWLAGEPALRVIPNAGARGLSGARNTGVVAAARPALAFLDDDAMAQPGWLDELRATFAGNADVDVIGTAVNAQWDGGRPPRWFPPEFGWVVGCGYNGLPTALGAVRNPIGASMAVRASAFAVAGMFSEVVGRVGTLPVGCEETEFCIRLTRSKPGSVILHQPASAVDHRVPVDRQTLRYFVSRCFHEGRSKSAVSRLAGPAAGLASERHYLRVTLPAGMARDLRRAIRRADTSSLVRAGAILLGVSATVTGFVSETVRRAFARRKPVEPAKEWR